MGKASKPRSGSMQYWPRKRAKSETVRVRSWANSKDSKILGFAGYKAGMTHALMTDNSKNSPTKGMKIRIPLTIIECPNLKVIGVRFYKKTFFGPRVFGEVEFKSDHKRLSQRKLVAKQQKTNMEKYQTEISNLYDIRLMVHTMPDKTTIGKKVPEVFEMGIGGSMEEKFNYAKDVAGKELSILDTFAPGEQIDVKAVTTGKGFQGPVKRFGISIRSRKSEKTKRGPGSISGGWTSQGHMMYRVAHAGQMGYHTRTEHNKQIVKITDVVDEINPKGGFIGYGFVNNPCVLVKGSVAGPKKRLIRFNKAIRPSKKYAGYNPVVDSISLESKQG